LAATIEAQGAISEERLAEAFDRLDSDDSGYISSANLKEILGADFPEEEIDAIIKEASKNGQISYSEFLALWEEQEEKKREEIVQEITVLHENRLRAEASDISVLSGISSDASEGDNTGVADFLARSTFIEGKALSERKVSAMSEPEYKPETSGSVRKVMFQDEPVTIPIDREESEQEQAIAAPTDVNFQEQTTTIPSEVNFQSDSMQDEQAPPLSAVSLQDGLETHDLADESDELEVKEDYAEPVNQKPSGVQDNDE